METIKSLLDQAKAAKGVESEYALAKALELTKQQVSEYYKGKVIPSEFACLQIAKALGRNYEEIKAIVRIEAEKDEKRRDAWKEFYKKLGGIAAGFVMAIFMTVTFFLTPTPAQAAPVLETQAGQFVLCKLFERLALKARRKKAQLLRLAQMLKKANFTLLPARISQVQTV